MDNIAENKIAESKHHRGGFKKYFAKIAGPAGVFFLALGFMLLSCGLFCVYNKTFYNMQFRQHEVLDNFPTSVNFDQAKLNMVRDQMIRYFWGTADSLQIEIDGIGEFFTEAELSHMADVKVMFDIARYGGLTLFLTGGGLLIAAVMLSKKGERLRRMFKSAVIGAGTFLGVIGAIALMIVGTGFERTFDIFHEMFFDTFFGGNWQFDYAQSNMLKILPGELFFWAAFIIIASGIIFAIVALTAGLAGRRVIRKKEDRELLSNTPST